MANVFEAGQATLDDSGLVLRVGQRINDRRDVAGLRQRVRRELAGGWLESRTDAVTLAATELAANGLIHGSQPVLFRLQTGPDRVVVSVFDSGAALPYLDPDVDPPTGAAAGRGLYLVCAGADRCGTRRSETAGKWVFAEWRRESDGAHAS